jgi:hypothetical protein
MREALPLHQQAVQVVAEQALKEILRPQLLAQPTQAQAAVVVQAAQAAELQLAVPAVQEL